MKTAKKTKETSTWQRSDRYVNREFSWLQFNRRVLAEAANPANPILERLKFLAIFESNLDEFYMVRVSGLIEQYESGVLTLTPDGLTPNEQLHMIAETAQPMRQAAADLWRNDLKPLLERVGVEILTWSQLDEAQRARMTETFRDEVFPLCTPVILHPAETAPFISSGSLNLAVLASDPELGTKIARVKVPTGAPRAIVLDKSRRQYLLLEDLIEAHLGELFPGVSIHGSYRFRVIRDADVEIKDLEAADLRSAVQLSLEKRRLGDPVLMEIESHAPDDVREVLMKLHKLEDDDVFTVNGLLGMDVLWDFAKLDEPSLRFPPHTPYLADALSEPKNLFATIAKQDVLVHHPFDSFFSVEQFVAAAAKDPDVVGIKQTLYRVGERSPIVESLLAAVEAGKQVAVLVELKARFDESNNLVWARQLERKGVHVSYGFPEMKVHCKLCQVVRREGGKLRTYAHIGTGNYNPATSRVYTDLGLFTCDPAITQDVSELFNYLTGFSRQTLYRELLVAPHTLRDQVIERIEREIEAHKRTGKGRIIIKLNSLVDPESIEALYDASRAGVQIDLIVRGISCLRPGVEGMSDNIRVRSIVGRFLEHSRVYYFDNGGQPEALIGSSDLMRRNLDRRIEVLTPVKSPKLVKLIHDQLLSACLRDNLNAWEQLADGSYLHVKPKEGEKEFASQRYLMSAPFTKLQFGSRKRD